MLARVSRSVLVVTPLPSARVESVETLPAVPDFADQAGTSLRGVVGYPPAQAVDVSRFTGFRSGSRPSATDRTRMLSRKAVTAAGRLHPIMIAHKHYTFNRRLNRNGDLAGVGGTGTPDQDNTRSGLSDAALNAAETAGEPTALAEQPIEARKTTRLPCHARPVRSAPAMNAGHRYFRILAKRRDLDRKSGERRD